MTEYHVGCGAFAIYAGILSKKDASIWQSKTECTDEVLSAAAQYLLQEGKSMRFNYRGKKYRLCVNEILQGEDGSSVIIQSSVEE